MRDEYRSYIDSVMEIKEKYQQALNDAIDIKKSYSKRFKKFMKQFDVKD